MKTTSVTRPALPFCANKDWQPFRASRCMHIKKIAAVCWYKLTIRKSSAPCYWWLIKTNPACNVWLNTVKTSPCDARRTGRTAGVKSPLRALVIPSSKTKSCLHSKKARDEYWHTLLQTLMASQPQLAEEVMPWLSTQAQAVVNGYLSASPKLAFESTHSNDLPEILVSPPWRGKKKRHCCALI